MSEQLIDVLFISSMVFFNLFCIVAIIAAIVVASALMSIRKNANETLASIKDATDNIGQISTDIADSWLPRLLKPRKTWVDFAVQLLKR